MTMPMRLSRRQRLAASVQSLQDAWTGPIIKAALVVIAVFGNSSFNAQVFPGGDESPFPQVIILAAWLVVALAGVFRRTIFDVYSLSVGLLWALAFYSFAMVSVLWSHDPLDDSAKALAIAITGFTAFRLTKLMPLDEIIEPMIFGLLTLCVSSIVLALFAPGIGLDMEYHHAGQWRGVFVNKQILGIASALLMFFSAYRLIGSRNLYHRLYHGLAATVALVCVVASGSRGGGALAAVAVLCVYLSARSASFTRILAFAPFAMCLIAGMLIIYMAVTGNPAIEIFDQEIDFTDRTLIWQHALAYFKDAPWFGYGLNGFWTLKEVKDLFLQRHGWFLDNFHDGYIGIIVETGVIGFALFVVSYLLYGLRLLADIRRDGALDRDVAFGLVFTSLLFFIDFTETFFLRSTNMASALLIISLALAYRKPAVNGTNVGNERRERTAGNARARSALARS